MPAELFGFKFERIKNIKSRKFTANNDDGTVEIGGGGFGQVLDTDSREAEVDLIRRYREISQQPECDSAIDDIVNGIVSNEKD